MEYSERSIYYDGDNACEYDVFLKQTFKINKYCIMI